jgi:hypothetical protein
METTYRNYTIKEDWNYCPYQLFYKFFPTSEGENDDADFDGDSYRYCGNGKWANSIQDAKEEIDTILYEQGLELLEPGKEKKNWLMVLKDKTVWMTNSAIDALEFSWRQDVILGPVGKDQPEYQFI